MNRRFAVFVSFALGAAAAIFVPKVIEATARKLVFPVSRTETMRVTSPDGTVDAVEQITDCGAPCSTMYGITLVPKGKKAPMDPAQQNFLAEDVNNLRLQWKQAHLLEIGYDRAFIHSYRNVAYPLGRPGEAESWRYEVEIRLAPTSPTFSYLFSTAK